MQVLPRPRWRNLLILKTSWIQSSSSSSAHLASFHSTPTTFDRRKTQSNFNHIRFETHQKRADTKSALKDLLLKSGSSKITFQDYFPRMDGKANWNMEDVDYTDYSDKKNQSKSSARRFSKAQHKRMKHKFRREKLDDDFDEHPDPIFQAKFGTRCYTWSFKSWEQQSYSQNSTNGFEWREHSHWQNGRDKNWQNESDIETDDESSNFAGSSSDRRILDLPLQGPLNIDDVKNAFRISALKWHPDKHQGPSQAMAEEKFKLCVDAYRSLCSALSST
ncbi:uncharacterized protein LOC127803983 [Diospyros lotus]|uniref:uncharacterized protein LOC127803983 n=1 Tax=Diospyros lotus TaxID=55363 RepID=UPI0022517A16|nr:uncharacterized protein LOC127803983 [Diospyros lotus]